MLDRIFESATTRAVDRIEQNYGKSVMNDPDYKRLQATMGDNGRQWATMGDNGRQWATMGDNGVWPT
ncbi:MAG: hypothetical protein GY822_15160 [Deltaproteobacteria bacterium]|nr:hypothetical protein [Deltaproteobacteria bacterium]